MGQYIHNDLTRDKKLYCLIPDDLNHWLIIPFRYNGVKYSINLYDRILEIHSNYYTNVIKNNFKNAKVNIKTQIGMGKMFDDFTFLLQIRI